MGKQLIATGQATVIAQKDPYTINQSVREYVFTAQNNGTVSAAVSFSSAIKVTLGDLNITDFTVGTITKPSGFSTITVNNTNKTVTYSVAAGTTTLADSGLIAIPVIIAGVTYQISFSWSKAKAGANGTPGTPGTPGVDANLLDWVQEWNSNKTIINGNNVITPKIFAGVKNANGTITGTSIGHFSLSTLNASGVVSTEIIDGIYGFINGRKTFSLDNTGDVQLGNGNQLIRYNASTGRIEFGLDVTLNWINAINTAKTETLNSAAITAQNKADAAKNAAISTAATDATNKINAVKFGVRNYIRNSNFNEAITGITTEGTTVSIDNVTLYNNYKTLKVIQSTACTDANAATQRTYFTAINNKTCSPASFSMYVKGSVAGNMKIRIGGTGIQPKAITTEWQKIIIENIIPTSAVVLFGFQTAGTYWCALPMLVEGTKAVDWSPAPEDINSSITDAKAAGTNAKVVADAITNKANNEGWSTKLTYVSSSGIFTGTLSANTVNALQLNASQITAGTISTARIDVASLKSSLITAGNIEALTLNVVKGKIGGWNVDADSMYRGVKNNIAGAYTSASGAVTIGSNGIRGFKWRLDGTGAGAVAGGNISWDASGNVSFGSSVVLNWTTPISSITTALGGSSYPKLTQISSTGIYTGTLTAAQVNSVNIDAGSIKTGTLSADRIATNSLNGNKITARTINADRIITGAISANEIAANTITAAKIASRTITADRIVAGAITASEINVGSIRASVLTADAVNALTCNFVRGKIGGFTIGGDNMSVGAIGAVGVTPLQIRSIATGSGYWYNGSYKPFGTSLLWHQSGNAGHIVFGQIAANGNTVKTGFVGIQMLAWDNTEYFCLSANYTKSGSKEVYNRIAGWAFDNTRIWKNNVSLGSDGTIYNGEKWRLNNDGSGKIANGNISWNAAGAVIFSSSVTLNWTNAATNALNSAKAYADTKKNEAISAASSDATTKTNAVKELASAMAFGKMLYRDPTFFNGNNGINVYNNSGNGTVTIIRTADSNAPNDSKQVLKIQTTGTASPGNGGFYFGHNCSYRKIFICRIIAKIPTGRNILWASNNIGTGGSSKWLTPTAGTGDWCEYVYKVVCGTGNFSSTNFFYLDGTQGTTAVPVVWYIAYATVFDVTSTEKYTTTIDGNGIYTASLNANQITVGAISADRIATGSLNGNKITARTITADRVVTGAITANEIAGNTITAAKIAARTITADRIVSGAITANEINVGSIQASVVTAGAVNGLTCTFSKGKIGGFTISGTAIYSVNVTPGHNVGIQSNGYIYNCNSSNTSIDYWALNTDGSAIFGSGKIKFGANGDGWLANKNITWDVNGNVSMTGTITATAGKIGNFNISGGKLVNSTTTASIEFTGLSGSSLYLNTTESLISIRSDINKTGISIQTYSSGARGIYVLANAGSKYAIEGYGPMQLGQRGGERWCVPGVLYVGCKYQAGYNNYYRKVWGDGMTVSSFSHIGDGKYRVYHNLGHTDYTVMAILWSSTGYYGYFRLLERTTSYFVIQNIGSSGKPDQAPFDFVVMGRNKW